MQTMIRAAAAAVVFSMALGAQGRGDAPRRGSDYRGPGLGVARVSLTDGDVRIVRPSGDDFQAQAGMPLVLGDRLIAGPKSRAEVQFDGGNFARLSAESEVRVGELGNKRFEVELVRGLLGFSQFGGFEADVDVETTLATVRPIKPAVFSVEHHGIGQTDVTVRDGAVEVFTDDGIEKLKGGLLVVRGQPDDVAVRTARAEPKSGFDDWVKRRDKLLERDGRSAWRNWVPAHIGLGVGWGGYGWGGYGWGGYGWGGYGYPWRGPRYRTTVFYRASPRVYRGGPRGPRRGRR